MYSFCVDRGISSPVQHFIAEPDRSWDWQCVIRYLEGEWRMVFHRLHSLLSRKSDCGGRGIGPRGMGRNCEENGGLEGIVVRGCSQVCTCVAGGLGE